MFDSPVSITGTTATGQLMESTVLNPSEAREILLEWTGLTEIEINFSGAWAFVDNFELSTGRTPQQPRCRVAPLG